MVIHVHNVKGRIAVVSSYLQPGTLLGLQNLTQIITALQSRNTPLLVCADLNGHSPWWGRSECNEAGEQIEHYILATDLHAHNDPKSPPTFQRASSSGQWLDLTLSSSSLVDKIQDWRVDPGAINFSDHELICWSLDLVLQTKPKSKGGIGIRQTGPYSTFSSSAVSPG